MSTGITEKIESKIDKGITGGMAISRRDGGLAIATMSDAMEFAKCMAISSVAVPPHCRNNAGVCLAITIQSIEWGMSPFAVANKSFVVNDRIGYESQLVHAVIEQRAPIMGRLRHSFAGEGDSRTCTVRATGTDGEEMVYTSPPFGRIQPKNSPLWKTKPDLQLYYNTSRDWARVWFPDVLLGVYAEDEIREAVAIHKSTATPRTETLTLALQSSSDVADTANEPTTEKAGGVDMAAFEAEMAKCTTQADCLNLLNLTFTPDAVYSDDQHQEAKTLCETRRAVIKKG